MRAEKPDTCYVASIAGAIGELNLTVYRAPGGWRWLVHDTATGSHTGDAAESAEHAQRAAEQFAREHVPGNYAVQWTMAFVRHETS
jgi:hypothetical protein